MLDCEFLSLASRFPTSTSGRKKRDETGGDPYVCWTRPTTGFDAYLQEIRPEIVSRSRRCSRESLGRERRALDEPSTSLDVLRRASARDGTPHAFPNRSTPLDILHRECDVTTGYPLPDGSLLPVAQEFLLPTPPQSTSSRMGSNLEFHHVQSSCWRTSEKNQASFYDAASTRKPCRIIARKTRIELRTTHIANT